ncbi:uncharacterized protein LOC103307538 isoform X2 [Chrysemys picta bellii]|uniref:uncharacterized protein LOC103307538 isoform X2 n=1 Tax=Chrysemys picta bellii TaxID=8478 RepID=UPI0032B1865F
MCTSRQVAAAVCVAGLKQAGNQLLANSLPLTQVGGCKAAIWPTLGITELSTAERSWPGGPGFPRVWRIMLGQKKARSSQAVCSDKKLARSRFKCWTPAFILLDPYLQLITVHCTRGFQALAFVGDRRLDESLDTLSTAEKHTISNCPPASNVYEEYGHSKKGLSMWRTTILAAPCKLEQWSLPTDGRGNHSEISGSIFWKALSQLQISNSIVLEKLIIRTIPPPIDFN